MTDQSGFGVYILEIQRDLEVLGISKAAISYLDKEEHRFLNMQDSYYSEMNQINVEEDSLYWAKTVGKFDLERAMEDAIANSEEFNVEPFKSRFVNISKDPNVMQITLSGGTIHVQFFMDKVAGTLKDWISAINKANSDRTNLNRTGKETGKGVGKFRKSSNNKSMVMPSYLANKMWAEKYYGPARQGTSPPGRWAKNTPRYVADYNETIRLRILAMSGIAPFWSIIEDGNKVFGGSGPIFPETKPQHFLQEARNRIEQSFESHRYALRARINEFWKQLDRVTGAIEFIQQTRREIQTKLDEEEWITMESRRSVKIQEYEQYTENVLKQRLGEKFSYVDEKKLVQLADDVYAGMAVPKRKTIGRNPATGNPITTRTKSLIAQAEKARRNR